MTRDWIFVPVIVQVLMTLLIYVRLIKVKVREIRAGTEAEIAEAARAFDEAGYSKGDSDPRLVQLGKSPKK